MPVWHEATKDARASGQLVVIGVIQEQHPERCRLFAQWHQIEWPILWDPFNTTGARVVPNFTAIDEHGVVRSTRAKPDWVRDAFLKTTYDPPADGAKAKKPAIAKPIEALLWKRADADMNGAIEALRAQQQKPGKADDPRLRFQIGVALRMRHDSRHAKPGDLQAALDAWKGALARNPNQYIWRRRLQQYGPRLDKPYPFYAWVEEARSAIKARGETPIALPVPLTGAERASPDERFTPAPAGAREPDPKGKIQRDTAGLVQVETALALPTEGVGAYRIHLTFRLQHDVVWNNEVEPLRVWIRSHEEYVDRRLLEHPTPAEAETREPRALDLEIRPAESYNGSGGTVKGYALYAVCEQAGGQCLYLRRDFEIRLPTHD